MKMKTCKKPGLKGQPHRVENISDFYIQKFHDRCEPQANGCIFLKGNVQNTGYINWWYRYLEGDEKILRFITAHRFSALISGKFAENSVNDYCVLHDCDQNYPKNDITYRQCVNPDHLFLGTVKDNIQDCINKGRYVKPPVLLGEDNHNAKLTEDQVLFIIENRRMITQKKLAKLFNVGVSTIEAIHMGKTWQHIAR